MEREYNSIFHFQSEIKNMKISKTSKEQTMIIPHFIHVGVKHQHLGHLAKVTNCHQFQFSDGSWLPLNDADSSLTPVSRHYLLQNIDLAVVDFELIPVMHLKHYTAIPSLLGAFFSIHMAGFKNKQNF